MEIWHEARGFDGWYEVSNQGRVRSWRLPGNGRRRAPLPRIIEQVKESSSAHMIVPLAFGGRRIFTRVNRLVLLTYIGDPPLGAKACHRNGDRSDNRLENLCWGDPAKLKQQQPDARTKLTWLKVRRIREMYATGKYSYRDLAAKYRVTQSTVWRIVTNKTWEERPNGRRG